MNKPLVSVIMSNYNTPLSYLQEAIDSILNQTYTNFEFIIIDDASTDKSLAFIKEKIDKRIIIHENNTNIGLTKSLNIGLKIANGNYIARMDSDDISLPTRFAEQVAYMEENKDVIVCGTWFEKFGEENRVRKPVIDDFEMYRCQLLFSNTPITVCHPSVMMRKSLLDKYSIYYDENLIKAQDYGMWVECSKHGTISIVKKILLRYRVHNQQISSIYYDEQQKCSQYVVQKQLHDLGITNFEKYINNSSKLDIVSQLTLYKKIIVNNNNKLIYSRHHLKKYVDEKMYALLKNNTRMNIIHSFIFGDVYVKYILASLFFKIKCSTTQC